MTPPQFVLIAGPNGAGKSTSAPALLPLTVPYVNADEIAKMLTSPGRDVQAGRLLLAEWEQLEAARANFGVETTLFSRTLAPRIARLRLSVSPDFSVASRRGFSRRPRRRARSSGRS